MLNLKKQSLIKSMKERNNSQAEDQRSPASAHGKKNENVHSLKPPQFMQFPGSPCISWDQGFSCKIYYTMSYSTTSLQKTTGTRYASTFGCCYLH